MNKNVRTIASIMIVLLALLLIVIFFSYNSSRDREYYRNRNVRASGDIFSKVTSGDKIDNRIEINESGEDIVYSGDEKADDTVSGDGEPEPKKPPKKSRRDFPATPSTETTVISSHTETSNQEKQEILNEIDDALKGLLDVVGKVKTVDESKLDASLESEVEP